MEHYKKENIFEWTTPVAIRTSPGSDVDDAISSFNKQGRATNGVEEIMEVTNYHTENEIKSLQVLVAEDNPLERTRIKTFLDIFGYSYEIVSNGPEVLEKVKSKEFDILLMDLQMPEMDSFECTRYLRDILHTDLPIIALITDVTAKDLEKYSMSGMNDTIAKPLNAELLFHKITNLVNEYKANTIDKEKVTRITNLDYLRRQTKSRVALMKEMISIYLSQTPPFIRQMKESVAAGNWELLYSAVHKIIPSFVIMGINPVYETLAKKIQENAYNNQNLELLPSMVEEIEEIVNKACRELETELKILNKINN
jgi:CheY-like chemotaxis protein